MGLQDCSVGATVPVTDMATAKKCYEGKLGLSGGTERGDGGVSYACAGRTRIHVYPSPDNAGKSGATLAAFQTDDVEGVVDELASSGVQFEHYDSGEIQTREQRIHEL